MKSEKALWKASGVFAPDYPRQSASRYTIQAERYSRSGLYEALQSAIDHEMPGYYSVYSFPRGHSREQNIPKVDCVFIDLDLEGGDYNPNEGNTDFGDWRREMSKLLARSRMIAKAILEEENQVHFRATLSVLPSGKTCENCNSTNDVQKFDRKRLCKNCRNQWGSIN